MAASGLHNTASVIDLSSDRAHQMLLAVQKAADTQDYNDKLQESGVKPANLDPDAGNPLANV